MRILYMKILYKGRKRKVYTGSRGGKYIIVNKEKKYIKTIRLKKKKVMKGGVGYCDKCLKWQTGFMHGNITKCLQGLGVSPELCFDKAFNIIYTCKGCKFSFNKDIRSLNSHITNSNFPKESIPLLYQGLKFKDVFKIHMAFLRIYGKNLSNIGERGLEDTKTYCPSSIMDIASGNNAKYNEHSSSGADSRRRLINKKARGAQNKLETQLGFEINKSDIIRFRMALIDDSNTFCYRYKNHWVYKNKVYDNLDDFLKVVEAD